MLKDKETQPATSSNKKKDSREPLKDLSTLKKFKSIDLDTSSGFICDINTGICGPVNQKKEGKE
jgi:hypothetical protein